MYFYFYYTLQMHVIIYTRMYCMQLPAATEAHLCAQRTAPEAQRVQAAAASATRVAPQVAIYRRVGRRPERGSHPHPSACLLAYNAANERLQSNISHILVQ